LTNITLVFAALSAFSTFYRWQVLPTGGRFYLQVAGSTGHVLVGHVLVGLFVTGY